MAVHVRVGLFRILHSTAVAVDMEPVGRSLARGGNMVSLAVAHGRFSACLFILLFLFQFSFFLWAELGLFLLFSFAFVFASLITHVCFSVVEDECPSRLRQTGLTFSALGPFGPCPSVNDTRCPSRSSS